jgi:hypothetical protein
LAEKAVESGDAGEVYRLLAADLHADPHGEHQHG